MRMFSLLRKQLLPQRCLICSNGEGVEDGVCRQCCAQIHPFPEPVCDICGTVLGTPGICIECLCNPPAYDKMLSACKFDGLMKDVIHRFKYHRATVFKKFLAKIIYRMVSDKGIRPDILTFVPLHWSRVIARGYNQSALIARDLSGYMGVDMRYGILHKTIKTPSQVGLPKKDRERNLKAVFSARGVEGKSVMVVDDVITTGRTAQEISKTLKHAGAEYVIFVSAGRTMS